MVALLLALSFHAVLGLTHAAGYPVACAPLTQYGYGPDVGGIALLDQKRIILSRDTCREFKGHPAKQLDALVTLGHERAHLLGIHNEHRADCRGIRDARWLGRRLAIYVNPKQQRRWAKMIGC